MIKKKKMLVESKEKQEVMWMMGKKPVRTEKRNYGNEMQEKYEKNIENYYDQEETHWEWK